MTASEAEVREIAMRASVGLLERIGRGGVVDARVLDRLSVEARLGLAAFTQTREANGQFGPGDGSKSDAGKGGDGKGFTGTYAGEGKEGFVSREEFEKAYGKAQDKIEACPKPTQEQIDKNRAMIAESKRAGGDFRGSSYQRRNNTGKLLGEFGNGEKAPCVWCGRELEASTLTQDKIYTGHEGGRYTFANLLPSCLGCNQSRGAASVTGSGAFANIKKDGTFVTASPLGWSDAQVNNAETDQDVAMPTLEGHPEHVTGKLVVVAVTNSLASIDYTKYIVGGVDVDPSTITEPHKPGPPANLDDLLSRTAAGAPDAVRRAESRKLVDIDRELRAKLHTAANNAMKRTLERCGAKIVSKSRTAAGMPLRPFIEGTPQYRVPMAVPDALLASLGLDEHVILRTSWDDLRSQFDKWVGDAQRSSARTAARIVKKSPDDAVSQLTRAQTVARDQAWNHLQQGLDAQALELLSATDDAAIDADSLVPLGGIRAALALAGGISATSAGIGRDGMPVSSDEVMGQVGTGGIISTYLEANGASVVEYEWVHGASDQPFLPHEDLDGVIFRNFDDPQLGVDGSFPETQFQHPGDHPGCSCDFIQHWVTGDGGSPDDTADAEAA